ncbi:hypothetical protein KAX35_06905, partial [candidate division WOR-3 bacterium]|nr:hypothetical protein [candidate division WOR-3 bacterium]
MKRLGIIVMLLIWCSLFASWIPFSKQEQEQISIALIRSNPQEIVVDIKVPGITFEYIDTKKGTFTRLSGGNGVIGDIGTPELPVIAKLFDIPQDAQVKIMLEEIETEEYSLSELGISHPIYPVQPPIPKIPGAEETIKFEMNESTYQSDRFFPEEVYSYADIVDIRGTRVIPVDFTPIQYNPVKNTIRVTKRMRVKLILSGSDISYTQWRKERYSSPYFNEILRKEIINYQDIKILPQIPIGYLIIVDDDLFNSIVPFAEWKEKKGFNATVTKTSEIPGGASSANISTYIEDAYNNWDIPPTFCLLVGDVGDVPASQYGTQTGKVTDLYYFTVDGSDHIPDIYYGRFSASLTSDIDAMVDKVVEYERNLWTQGTDW